MSLRLRTLAAGALLVVLTAGSSTPALAAAKTTSAITIVSLSNRADLLSGGGALIRVVLPRNLNPAGLSVSLDGRDVSSAFAARPGLNGWVVGLLNGMSPGQHQLVARRPGATSAQLTLTEYKIGGPVFAGPQTQPWFCTTASNGLGPPQDAQCDAPTAYFYFYKSSVTGAFTAFDPGNAPPPSLVATTTTDQGRTVPYIVRDERGTIDRGIYDIAVLFDPSRGWTAWNPQPGWDHKLGFKFGGGCAPGHSQQSAQDPKDDMFLSRGYMVAVSSIDVNGNSCNPTTSAESLMMIKERIVERYGLIRFTMGDGCSGGAEQQHSISDQYPGLINGIRPECTFPDLWTIAIWEKWDCQLLENYFDNISPQLWAVEPQRAAVLGGSLSQSMCLEISRALNGAEQDWNPAGDGCGSSGSWEYSASNPSGTRCSLQDYNRNALGSNPATGFANFPIDRVGVQWGLSALQAGQITPEQFVDLNQKIGGFNVNFQWQPGRSQGDPTGIANMYRADELSFGANWALVPEIEARADDTYDEHSNVMHAIDLARLQGATGSTASQVFWQEPLPGAFGMPTPDLHQRSFAVMDQWLTNIERDTSSAPLAAKVVRDKPAAAVSGCYVNGGLVTQSVCDTVRTSNVLPAMVAGEPLRADVLKCQLKPLVQSDYFPVLFSDSQWAALEQAFPQGVCDWSRPGVGQQAPIGSWLAFDVAGGRPLGPAPQSSPV